MYKDVHFSAATDAIATKYTSMYISEPPRMAVVPRSSDVSVICNIHAANYLASFTKISFCETSFLIYPPAIHGGIEPKLASKN